MFNILECAAKMADPYIDELRRIEWADADIYEYDAPLDGGDES